MSNRHNWKRWLSGSKTAVSRQRKRENQLSNCHPTDRDLSLEKSCRNKRLLRWKKSLQLNLIKSLWIYSVKGLWQRIEISVSLKLMTRRRIFSHSLIFLSQSSHKVETSRDCRNPTLISNLSIHPTWVMPLISRAASRRHAHPFNSGRWAEKPQSSRLTQRFSAD